MFTHEFSQERESKLIERKDAAEGADDGSYKQYGNGASDCFAYGIIMLIHLQKPANF